MIPTTLAQAVSARLLPGGSRLGEVLRRRRYKVANGVGVPGVWGNTSGWLPPSMMYAGHSPAVRTRQQETAESAERQQRPTEATAVGAQTAFRLLRPDGRLGVVPRGRVPGTNLPATGLDAAGSPFAATLPGRPGHAAVNVIDQQGALDPTGRTVDGNNAAGVRKMAPGKSL